MTGFAELGSSVMKKMKKGKKTLKIVLWSIGVFFAFLLFAFLIHPLWIGSVASGITESTVAKMTKADFDIDEFDVNLYTGQLTVKDVELESIGEEEPEDALKLGLLDVSFSTVSMLFDTKRISEIRIVGLEIYANSDFSNLYAIVDNVNKYLAEHADDAGETANYEIDRIVLNDAKFIWNWNNEEFETIPLPDIEILGTSVRPEGTYIKEVVVNNLTLKDDVAFSRADKLNENLNKAAASAKSGAEENKSVLVIDKIRFVDARIGIGYLPEIPLPNFEISDIGKEEESNAAVLKSIGEEIGEIIAAECPKIQDIGKKAFNGIKGVLDFDGFKKIR
jgi:hypothetical protein